MASKRIFLFGVALALVSGAACGQSPAATTTSVPALPDLPPLGAVSGLPGQSKQGAPSTAKERQIHSSAKIFRQVLPDGSIAYSDHVLPGAVVQSRLDESSPQSGISFGSEGRKHASIDVKSFPSTKPHDNSEALAAALEKQKRAVELRPGDRIMGTRKNAQGIPYSRLSPEYFDRQEKAAAEVEKIKNVTEGAETE
jgi:hypothetical protein